MARSRCMVNRVTIERLAQCGVTDSPAVADLKRKLDLLAAALVAAIAAILIRKFLRSLGEGEL